MKNNLRKTKTAIVSSRSYTNCSVLTEAAVSNSPKSSRCQDNKFYSSYNTSLLLLPFVFNCYIARHVTSVACIMATLEYNGVQSPISVICVQTPLITENSRNKSCNSR